MWEAYYDLVYRIELILIKLIVFVLRQNPKLLRYHTEFNLLMYSREALSLESMINVDFLFACKYNKATSHGIDSKEKCL